MAVRAGKPLSGSIVQNITQPDCYKRMPTPSDRETLKTVPWLTVFFKQACACFTVTKLVVHSSLAHCPGSSPKECSLWETPSSDTPDTLPQENHAFIRKQNPFVYFVLFAVKKQTGLPCFAVTKLVVHGSLTHCPGSSPKECSLWKTPSPDTLGTLPQENHTFIRKQNPFVFFVVKKQTDLHVLSGC